MWDLGKKRILRILMYKDIALTVEPCEKHFETVFSGLGRTSEFNYAYSLQYSGMRSHKWMSPKLKGY